MKNNHKRYRKVTALVLILPLLAYAAAILILWKSPGDVASIYARHSSFDGVEHLREVKVDVENGLYLEFDLESAGARRDQSLAHEGYPVVGSLDDRELERFFRTASLWGFWGWRGYYRHPRVLDGDSWEIVVTYRDGTASRVGGYHRYPWNWAPVSGAFFRLTGQRL